MLSFTIKVDQEEVTSPTFNSSFELESDQASVPSDVEEATLKQRDYAKTDFNASRKVSFPESSSDEWVDRSC